MTDPTEEVDSPRAGWYRSTFCESNGCLEVLFIDGQVAIRNSTNPDGPILSATPAEWQAFVKGVSNSEFDLT